MFDVLKFMYERLKVQYELSAFSVESYEVI